MSGDHEGQLHYQFPTEAPRGGSKAYVLRWSESQAPLLAMPASADKGREVADDVSAVAGNLKDAVASSIDGHPRRCSRHRVRTGAALEIRYE